MARDTNAHSGQRNPLRIVAGQKQTVGLWLLDRLPDLVELPGGYEAIGIARDGKLVGGCIYSHWRPCEGGGDLFIWAAGDTGWLSRRTIKELLGYPFRQLGCHRVSAAIAKGNKRSRKMVQDLGFELEGVRKKGMNLRMDECMYGLLRDKCRWI